MRRNDRGRQGWARMKGTKRGTVLLVLWVATTSSLYSATKKLSNSAPQAEQSAASSAQTPELSFDFFKTRVQPIFLKSRAEHARCYGCHILPNRIFRLQPLSPGTTDWSDEQSQQNFQSV